MTSDILHLGAMAVLVGTVALGLEKVRMEGDPLTVQVKALQARIADEITKFNVKICVRDPVTQKLKISDFCNNRHFHYLLRVTRNPERRNYPWRQRCTYRRKPSYWSAVLLNAMRTGWHVYVLFGFAVLSVFCFLLQEAGDVYHYDHVGPFFGVTIWGLQDICLYWIYMTTIIATLGFAIAAHMLATVEPRCNRYIAMLELQKIEIDAQGRENMLRESEAYSGSKTPPTPRDLRHDH